MILLTSLMMLSSCKAPTVQEKADYIESFEMMYGTNYFEEETSEVIIEEQPTE